MNFKLAVKNVKKSFKNYTVYFLTLSVAVCIFYAFNSIGAQSQLKGISAENKSLIQNISMMIGYISVFVAVVLACLIIYANNFLIKRRKKELGLYMSLGMGKRKMSSLLVVEELIIGVVSLVCGILGGIVVSQFIGVLTKKVFQISTKGFQFIISGDSIIKTIIYFGIIFMIVMIFNTIIISRYKLIDLITAHKKNEKIKVKNPVIAAVIFIISIVLLITAYSLVIKTGLNTNDLGFKLSIILGVIGTGLFFYGLTGFIVLIIQKIKAIYYKKLNIFTVRQVNSKINTNFIAMTVICLMLFLTISMISVAVGFKNQNINSLTPVDASISNMFGSKLTAEQYMKYNNIKIPEGSSIAVLNQKEIKGVNYKEVLSKYLTSNIKKSSYMMERPIEFISLKDYNNYLKLLGKNTVSLKNNQIIAISNAKFMKPVVEKITKDGGVLKILNKEYTILNNKVLDESISTSMGEAYGFVVVANSDLVNKGKESQQIININYGTNKKVAETALNKEFNHGYINVKGANGNSEENSMLFLTTKIGAIESQSALTSTLLYLTIYIGSIFLIASAAVLALQQLSEASDSHERYKSLRKIGASKKQINKSIFVQTSMYFALPLVLAIVHASVGIYVGSDLISSFGKANIMTASLMTMGAIIVIYMGYFLVTYMGYKAIVRGENN